MDIHSLCHHLQGTVQFGDRDVRLMIAGDPVYPLLPWLVKGYTGALTEQQAHFNERLSHARVPVEHAFGRYKARWRRPLKRSEVVYSVVPKVAVTCAILHNFVEDRGEISRRSGWRQPLLMRVSSPLGKCMTTPKALNSLQLLLTVKVYAGPCGSVVPTDEGDSTASTVQPRRHHRVPAQCELGGTSVWPSSVGSAAPARARPVWARWHQRVPVQRGLGGTSAWPSSLGGVSAPVLELGVGQYGP